MEERVITNNKDNDDNRSFTPSSRVDINLSEENEMTIFEENIENFYLFDEKGNIYILPKAEVEGNYNVKNKIIISDLMVTVEEKNLKLYSVMLTNSSTITRLETEADTKKAPKPDIEGVVDFSYKDKKSKKIYVRTENNIVVLYSKNIILPEGLFLKIYFVKKNLFEGVTYLNTMKHTFHRLQQNSELENCIKLSKNLHQGRVNSLHYVEGILLVCHYYKSDPYFTDERQNWGIFSFQMRGEQSSFDVSLNNEAFKYFRSIDFNKMKNWQESKKALDEFFASKKNRAKPLRVLIRVTLSRGKRSYQIVKINGLDIFSK